jgi:hypothetical protein
MEVLLKLAELLGIITKLASSKSDTEQKIVQNHSGNAPNIVASDNSIVVLHARDVRVTNIGK